MDRDNSIKVQMNPKAVEQYNKENGSGYKILPSEYYTFNNNSFIEKEGTFLAISPLSVRKIFPTEIKQVTCHLLQPVMNSSKTYILITGNVVR